MTLYYPDVSNCQWQNTAEATTFVAALPGEGFGAVCHKVSEGTYYTDPYWRPVLAQAQQSGLIAIGYHYVTTDPPAAQAALYRNTVGDIDVPCMLDFEANSGDLANFWAVWQAFTAAGVNVRLSYIPHWYWQNIGSPPLTGVQGLVASNFYERGQYASIEYADAGGDTGPGWLPYGGVTPSCWQFTDAALIAGINVDANAFRGDLDDFNALLGITATTGGNTVTPVPNPSTLAIAKDNQIQLRGPTLAGWPQLDGNTLVDAIALIGEKLGIDGFGPTHAD